MQRVNTGGGGVTYCSSSSARPATRPRPQLHRVRAWICLVLVPARDETVTMAMGTRAMASLVAMARMSAQDTLFRHCGMASPASSEGRGRQTWRWTGGTRCMCRPRAPPPLHTRRRRPCRAPLHGRAPPPPGLLSMTPCSVSSPEKEIRQFILKKY
jgi:hypothetical protein